MPEYKYPKLDHFVAKTFYIHFSGNPANVTGNSIFGVSKTLQKVMKITHFDVLGGPFVDLGRVLSRVFKIMQKYAKMIQNAHKIIAK